MKRKQNRILFLTLLLAMVVSFPVMAQSEQSMQRTISVSGEGIFKVEPDLARVRFGIITRDTDPEEARRRNAESARKAMNAVRNAGVDERKIKLESLRLQPAYEYNQETRRNEEVGFEATRSVVVEVNDLEKLPQIVAEIVQQGANRLDGIAYDLSDRNAVRNEALQQAVLHAREKATLMTTTLGVTIGPVLTIVEEGISIPQPVYRAGAQEVRALQANAGPEPEAYASGEIEVRANCTVVFELK